MRRIVIMLAVILMLSAAADAQEIDSVETEGNCTDFTVTVIAANLTEGCWDVKLDVPGQIETEDGWKSTFYYKSQALCYPDTNSVTVNLQLESRNPVARCTAKLRLDSKVIEKDFEIQQSCPPPPESLPDNLILIIVFGIILIFGWLITWWWKGK